MKFKAKREDSIEVSVPDVEVLKAAKKILVEGTRLTHDAKVDDRTDSIVVFDPIEVEMVVRVKNPTDAEMNLAIALDLIDKKIAKMTPGDTR